MTLDATTLAHRRYWAARGFVQRMIDSAWYALDSATNPAYTEGERRAGELEYQLVSEACKDRVSTFSSPLRTSPQIDHDLTTERDLVNAALEIVKRSQALYHKQWGNRNSRRDPKDDESIQYSRWLNKQCEEFLASYNSGEVKR